MTTENIEKPTLKITDGNAFAILAKAHHAALKHNLDWNTIQAEATSSDYNHLLTTMAKYFNVR